mgnify:FL=1
MIEVYLMGKCSTDLIRLVFYNPRGFDSFCGKGAAMANHAEFDAFVETIAKLRAPDGCPWDREQTHASIAHNMIEEAYEAVDAIEACDVAHLREELGDVLLQVVSLALP